MNSKNRVLLTVLYFLTSSVLFLGCKESIDGGFEDPPPTPSITSPVDEKVIQMVVTEGFTITENGTALIVVLLSKAAPQNESVAWEIQDVNGDPATADFAVTSGTFTINQATQTTTFNVTPLDDDFDEPLESFSIRLTPDNKNFKEPDGGIQFDVQDNDDPPIFTFASTAQVVTEGNQTAINVPIESPTGGAEAVTLTYSIGGTATNGVDYGTLSGSLVIPKETLSTNLTITLTDDGDTEGTETLDLTLLTASGASANLGSQVNHSIGIYDDESGGRGVDFQLGSSSVREDAGSIPISVQLSSSDPGTITVDYQLRIAGGSGTATSPSDYTFTPGTLTFNPGETSKSFNFSVTDNSVFESAETVIFEITNVTGAASLGLITEHTVTINDDDNIEVNFLSSTSNNNEDAGMVNITVNLNAVSASQIDVPYTVSGTASNPNDHNLTDGTLIFTPGQTSKNISVTIVQDGDAESDEFIVVNLGTPTNAVLGSTSMHIMTVRDDDSGPDLYLSGLGGSTIDGVAITSCGGSDVCNSSNPYLIDADITYGNITLENSAVLSTTGWVAATTPAPGNGILKFQVAGDLSIESGSAVSVYRKGYTLGNGPSAGASASSGAGGGHGGQGGNASHIASSGATDDSITEPIGLGSGGGVGSFSSGAGGYGGGAVHITVLGTLNLDGSISANGGNAKAFSAFNVDGGGAGGSIYINTNNLNGSGGSLRAAGGDGGSNVRHSGGGGGGRIALHFTNDNYTGTFQSIQMLADAGVNTGSNGKPGGIGSVYVKDNGLNQEYFFFDNNNESSTTSYKVSSDLTTDNLTIRNGAHLEIAPGVTLTVANSNYAGGTITNNGTLANPIVDLNYILNNYGIITYPSSNLTIKAGGHLTDFVNTVFNDVTIESGGQLTMLSPMAFNNLNLNSGGTIDHLDNTTSKTYFADISVTNTFNLNGTINVTRKGYSIGNGPSAGVSATSGAGGGHGGQGGNAASVASSGSTDDSVTNPVDLGSGGGAGSFSSGAGGYGGGLVKINTSIFNFNGAIYANGGNATTFSAYHVDGGGAGGSINITTTTLTGAGGILQAKGGDGGSNVHHSGGGGGGRIALNFTTDSYTGTFQSIQMLADAGTNTGSNGQPGALGSIYVKDNGLNEEYYIFDGNNESQLNPYKLLSDLNTDHVTFKNNAHVQVESGVTLTVNGNRSYIGSRLTNYGTLANSIVDLDYDLINYGTLTYPSSNLTIKSGGHLTDYVNMSFNDVTIENGGTMTLMSPISFANYTVQSGALVNHLSNTNSKTNFIDVSVSANMTLNGTINVNGLGYSGGNGPSAGSTSTAGTGGGHGGAGGSSSTLASSGATDDNIADPNDFGSSGGVGTFSSGGGGAGGGLVRLNVTGTLDFNGSIYANGNNANTYSGFHVDGGGAGGGIKIVTGDLTGAGGVLQAKGGNGNSNVHRSGGGGGGLIDVEYVTDSYSGGVGTISMDVSGGTATAAAAPGGTGLTQTVDLP